MSPKAAARPCNFEDGVGRVGGTSLAQAEVGGGFMNRLLILVCGAALTVACSREPAALSIPTGSQVSVEKSDGVKVEGKLVEVTRDRVIVEQPTGQRTTVSRGDISAIRTA